MKVRVEGQCEFCGRDLTGEEYEETHTRNNHGFCDYSCMEGFYGDEIPDNEDFLAVPK